jgi:tetratricopeptide (TPR) repeat protein
MPQDAQNAFRYLDVLLYQGDFKTFERVVKELEQRYPRHPQVLRRLADFYEGQMMLSEASRFWERLLDLGQLTRDDQEKLLVYYMNSKKLDALARFYQKVALRQTTPDYLYSLAQLYASKRDLEQQRRIFEIIARKFPGEEVAKRRLVDIYEYLGDQTQAEKLLWQLFEENPDKLEYAQRLMERLISAGEKQSATGVLAKVLQRFQGRDRVMFAVAEYLLRIGDQVRARVILDDLYRRQGKDFYQLDRMAEIYFEMSQYDRALELLGRFNEQTGGNYHSHHVLGDVLAALGDSGSSRREYERALELIRQ